MSAVLIISIFLLALTSLAILRSKRSASARDASESLRLPPLHTPRGLFDSPEDEAAPNSRRRLVSAAAAARVHRREELRARAAAGDFAALDAAHLTADRELYREVLELLVEKCYEETGRLCALASHIVRQQSLRAGPRLAAALLAAWKLAPTQISTTEMLHIAALSDDPAAYASAVETVLAYWKQGRLPEFTAADLRRLFESEYWVLGADTKRSGAGFVLRRTLADARRQLSAATPREVSHSNEAG